MKRKETFKGLPVVCSKCGAEAVGVSGSKHRRCPGGANQPLRDKRDKLPTTQRGTWA